MRLIITAEVDETEAEGADLEAIRRSAIHKLTGELDGFQFWPDGGENDLVLTDVRVTVHATSPAAELIRRFCEQLTAKINADPDMSYVDMSDAVSDLVADLSEDWPEE